MGVRSRRLSERHEQAFSHLVGCYRPDWIHRDCTFARGWKAAVSARPDNLIAECERPPGPHGCDVKRKRLFVAGLENGTLEVVDLQAGKWVRSIPGFEKPQGALYVPELNKLFVASGDDGMLRVFWGDTLDLLDPIQLDRGPNRIVYEPHSKLVYVGYGGKDAGKDYGEVGIIDAKKDKRIGDIKVVAHPSE